MQRIPPPPHRRKRNLNILRLFPPTHLLLSWLLYLWLFRHAHQSPETELVRTNVPPRLCKSLNRSNKPNQLCLIPSLISVGPELLHPLNSNPLLPSLLNNLPNRRSQLYIPPLAPTPRHLPNLKTHPSLPLRLPLEPPHIRNIPYRNTLLDDPMDGFKQCDSLPSTVHPRMRIHRRSNAHEYRAVLQTTQSRLHSDTRVKW